MRVVIADCEVNYSGRGDTWLPRARRMIVHKDDGSIGVHGFTGVKPLNYMGAGATFTEVSPTSWVFDLRQESIEITLHEIYSDSKYLARGEEPGLLRDGTEAHLQEWLSRNLATLDSSLRFEQREVETGAGPVDILATNVLTAKPVMVEVKRVATTPAIHQVRRYAEAYPEEAEMVVVAFDIRPKAIALAEKHGVKTLFVPASVKGELTQERADNDDIANSL